MIHIYSTKYSLKDNEKKYQKEHYLGRYLLSKGLKKIYDLEFNPEEIENFISRNEHGKPYLKEYDFIKFNISHSDGLVVCAISDREIGIDVEKITDFKDGIIRKLLSDTEKNILSTYADNEDNYNTVFYKFWSLKESYLKYKGLGFSLNPLSVNFFAEDFLNSKNINCSDKEVVLEQKILNFEYILAICYARRDEKIIHEMI